MTAAERAAEQDQAADGRDKRVLELASKRLVLASVYLRLPPKSRRVYAYLRWAEGRKTHENYVCQVDATTRAENLAIAWRHVHANRPPSATSPSWASTPESRVVMSGNRSRDTRPELALRSAVHARGLRYRVATRPIPTVRRTADLVFPGARVAVFLDGCFWHGCPDHYRPSTKNAEFWADKIARTRERDEQTDELLRSAGWMVVRIWEHESPDVAANRVEAAVIHQKLTPMSPQ